MWEYVFKVPGEQDPTPEELKIRQDEFTKMKAEWLKKAKKKKWNEELEKELIEDYRKRLQERVANKIYQLTDLLVDDGDLLRLKAAFD